MPKPVDAEHVTSYGGDAFGNGANNLWRCKRCGGLFYTGAAYDEPVRIGLILIERGQFPNKGWETAKELYRSQPHCQCEDREAIRNPGLFEGSFRRGQPPVNWLPKVREIRELPDKRDEDES